MALAMRTAMGTNAMLFSNPTATPKKAVDKGTDDDNYVTPLNANTINRYADRVL